MKTTKANYAKHLAAIKISDMPAALQTSHKTVCKNTDGYKDWSAFNNGSGPDYLDLYFAKFDAWREPARKAAAAAKKADGRRASATRTKAKATRSTSTRRTAKTPAAVERAMAMPMAEKKPKTAQPRKVAPRAAGAAKSRAKTTRSTKSQRASNERSLIKVKDADTLSGLSLLRERDRLAKQIHQKSKTQAVREVPVYRVSIKTAKKQAYNALKATMDGKVKNIKIKTRPKK